MSPFPTDTLEIDAQGREALVLDVALPVLGALAKSVRIVGFRPSMGVSGLSPREVARLRTLGLATSAKATGIFEGANDFRMNFPANPLAFIQPSAGVEADLGGHPLPPLVSDLTIAAFGLPEGKSVSHELRGFTHQRAASAQGYGARTLEALGRELGLDLKVTTRELGFEPQGQGVVKIEATRTRAASDRLVDWKDPGELRAVHVMVGGVRPKLQQIERLEAALREGWWEARRVEPVIERHITTGVDMGGFLQLDVACERGGATFVDVVSRSAAPLPLARRAIKKALTFLDSSAACDEITGTAALAAAVAARAEFEIALVPSERLGATLALLRDLGAYVEEEEAPGLVLLKTK